jgi:hypothetical protein
MKKNILSLLALVGLCVSARAQQVLTNALAVKPIVPYSDTQVPNVSITSGTAVEITGNKSSPSTSAGLFGVMILNWSTSANIFCCPNDSACSASAGAHQGFPILQQPSGGNYNWQYFSIPTWEPMYCIASASGVTAYVLKFK